MGLHLVVMGKLKLLAGGHSNWQLLLSLLCPFALKLPFAASKLPTSCTDLAVSVRFFVFRLNRIIFDRSDPMISSARERGSRRRWERAIRLLHDRAVGNDDSPFRVLRPNEEMLNAITMLAL